MLAAAREGVDAAAVVGLERVGRAARIVQPRLDGAGVVSYLVEVGVDVGAGHGQADELDGPEVFLAEICSPAWRDVAALDDEVLPVLDGRLHHLAHDGPEVCRELFVVFGREAGVAASDEAHLQVVDGKVRVAESSEHALGKEGLAGMRCAGYENGGCLAFAHALPILGAGAGGGVLRCFLAAGIPRARRSRTLRRAA